MKTIIVCAITAALACAPASMTLADDFVQANGRVLASDGKTPLEGAMLAVYDEKANVVAHAKTGADGKYSMTVPKSVLHLSPKRGGGNFLGSILGGVKQLASVAATVAPYAMGPAGLGASALTGQATQLGSNLLGGGGLGGGLNPFGGGGRGTGSQQPTAAQMRLMKSQLQMVKRMGPKGVNYDFVDSMFDSMSGGGSDEPTANSPGALVLRVTRAGSTEAGGVGQVYWLQDEAIHEDDNDGRRTSVWVDPIWLSKDGEQEPSRIVRGYFALAKAAVDPAIVEFAQTLSVSVTLPIPDEPKVDVVVIARDAKSGVIFELAPGENGVYKAEIPVDKKFFAKNDQTLSILAYSREAGTTGRSKKAEDAISGAGMWKLDKNFEYNPRIVVSRNRLDLKVTVVEPAKAR